MSKKSAQQHNARLAKLYEPRNARLLKQAPPDVIKAVYALLTSRQAAVAARKTLHQHKFVARLEGVCYCNNGKRHSMHSWSKS